MSWLETLNGHWAWLALGLFLAVAEIMVPLSLALQIVIFAVLAIAAVFSGRRFLRSHPVESADPLMNDRGGRLVGETVLVTSVIVGGTGRIKYGDSEWLARGPDAEPGTRMRVSGHDGAVLLVEHMH
jgi:membrane protein implicated in regulation of membrane protease activity